MFVAMRVEGISGGPALVCCAAELTHVETVLRRVVESTQSYHYLRPSARQLPSHRYLNLLEHTFEKFVKFSQRSTHHRCNKR